MIQPERWKFIDERIKGIRRRQFFHSEELTLMLKWCEELLKAAQPQKKPNCILCIDQSYSRIGFAVIGRKKIYCAESMDLTKLKTPTNKRNAVREMTRGLIEKWNPRIVVVERVRFFAGAYITTVALPLAALTAVIVDSSANYFNLKTYAINTQSWKKTILGDSNAKKADAVAWIDEMFGLKVNHDAADAACMGFAIYRGCKVKRQL